MSGHICICKLGPKMLLVVGGPTRSRWELCAVVHVQIYRRRLAVAVVRGPRKATRVSQRTKLQRNMSLLAKWMAQETSMGSTAHTGVIQTCPLTACPSIYAYVTRAYLFQSEQVPKLERHRRELVEAVLHVVVTTFTPSFRFTRISQKTPSRREKRTWRRAHHLPGLPGKVKESRLRSCLELKYATGV